MESILPVKRKAKVDERPLHGKAKKKSARLKKGLLKHYPIAISHNL